MLRMSFCYSGLQEEIAGAKTSIAISNKHPLIILANRLPWKELSEFVLDDLKKTTKNNKWWVGRALKIRIHLGVYVLQQLFNKTDRQIEYDVKDNAAYQLFCGRRVVKQWHGPDHTKIEEFRSRLSSETQRKLANHIVTVANQMGLIDATKMDIDSTVQEANISYPSDVNLLGSLSLKVKKAGEYLIKKGLLLKEALPEIDLKKIKSGMREYFFSKKKPREVRTKIQKKLWRVACGMLKPYIRFFESFDNKKLPWNIARAIDQIQTYGKGFLIASAKFFRTGRVVTDKILSFHAQAVSCFNKNKLDKRLQFGRNFQLGRISNFLIVGQSKSLRQDDRASLKPLVELHEALFPEKLNSLTADKGYYTNNNELFLIEKSVKEIGLQHPAVKHRKQEKKQISEELINRRAGIEPLIGHAKQGGQLSKSRMKSDKTTLSAGYTAILSFNLRQLMRGFQKTPLLC